MYQVLDRLPQMAFHTKAKFSQAIENLKSTTYISQAKLNPLKLASLLNSKYNEELIEAIKILFALYLQGKDLQVYLARIINLLPRDDLELKRVCQILLLEVSAQKNQKNDVLLLSISPIYKDIVSSNTSIKLFALKTLPSLGIEEMTHLMLASLKQIVVDKNQLVRKLSALSLLKLRDISPDDITSETYQEPLEFLLKDSPQVRNVAVYVMAQLQNDLTFMHQKYFQLIKDLPYLNQLEIERSLRQLTQYAQYYLKPDSQDLLPLLDQAERLLKLPYPGIVLAVAHLMLLFPQVPRIKKLIRTLIRFLNISSESKFIVLSILHEIAIKYPDLLREYYRIFTIIQIEKLYCKIKKLEILHCLIDQHNFSIILEELLHHTKSNQPQLVGVAVQLLGKTTQNQFVRKTVRSLIELLKNGTPESKNHATIAFCSLMSNSPSPLSYLTLCFQYIDDIQDIFYKCSIIKLLRKEYDKIPSIATENLRKLSLQFLTYHENVKCEVLSLAALVQGPMLQYLLDLARYDQSFLVRDYARMIEQLGDYKKVPAQYAQYLRGSTSQKSKNKQRSEFYVGSMSHLVGYRMKGYQEINEKCPEDTSALRKVVEEKKETIEIKPVVVQKEQQAQQQVQPQKEVKQQSQNVEKKKKEIEEEVKKHYSNLDQALNDFFVDE